MIRKATTEDIDRIMEILDIARDYMRSKGNMNQWINGYPQRELIAEDIAKGYGFCYEEGGEVHGYFAFITGIDHTYNYIEGKWLNDEPYGTIHRVASDGTFAGFLSKGQDYCFDVVDNLRLDTHEDNAPMRKAAEALGFTYCGTIYIDDGSPRRAYHKVKVHSET